MDITSLHTVILDGEGILVLKHFFDQRSVKEPSSKISLRLAELVLRLNCFSFGGNYYKQTNGVAMGIKMEPSYAYLLKGFIEHQFFNQCKGPKPDLFVFTTNLQTRIVPCCIHLHIPHKSRIPFLFRSFSDFVVYVVTTLIFQTNQR